MSLPPNDNSVQSANPYQPVNVEAADESAGRTGSFSYRWAGRLAQLGFVSGLGLGIVLGTQVIRYMLWEGGLANLAPALGACVYAVVVMTCLAGLPLAISGWIIGSLIDLSVGASAVPKRLEGANKANAFEPTNNDGSDSL